MMKINMIILVMLISIGCSTNKKNTHSSEMNQEVSSSNPLEGNWVLRNVLMGDAMDAPCGLINEGKTKEMNITFLTAKNEIAVAHGQSSVNSFSVKYIIQSYDEKTKTGKIKFQTLISTRMASVEPVFMECEKRFFSYLQESEDFKITDGKLQLIKTFPISKDAEGNSVFEEANSNILYFEKQ